MTPSAPSVHKLSTACGRTEVRSHLQYAPIPMKFTAKIGKTKYELEETSNPKVLKLTKGEQVSFLPKELIVEYVAYKGGAKLFELTRDALSKALE